MILLPSTTDKLQLITSAAGNIDVHCSYAEFNSSFATSGLGKQNTNITTATTTDILAAPGASTTRNLKYMIARNKSATVANDITVVYDANGTDFELIKVTLQPGDQLEYHEGKGFFVITNITSGRLITNVEPSTGQNVFRSVLGMHAIAAVGGHLMISGTAHYVYMGRVAQAITVKFVELVVTTAGAGAQTAEVGLFSTPTAPSKSAQTLTKIVATGTVDSLTTTGVKRNTTTFDQLVAAGTHLWAAFRTAMATTQPTVLALEPDSDFSQGHVMTTTGGGALTGLSTAAGSLLTMQFPPVITTTCADLRVVLN